MKKTELKKSILKMFIFVIIVTLILIAVMMYIKTNIQNISVIKKIDNGTIGSISYDYNSNLDYTIYINENDKYIPYLVLTYNYNKTNNCLCLRKNVIGGENGYIIDFNGTVVKDKIDKDWIEMDGYDKYEETDVDKYLSGEFEKKFDDNFLSKICNTQLSFSEYDYNNEKYKNYEISRKFFILSLTELNAYGSSFDNKTKNKMKLKYFSDFPLVTTNDIGEESPYWTRTTGNQTSYYMVGYTGGIAYTGSNAKFGVRPAFTIPNNTKIKKIYNEEFTKEIYILDI